MYDYVSVLSLHLLAYFPLVIYCGADTVRLLVWALN